MTCKEFASMVDIYLRGDIPAEKCETFELHYFECDDCFTLLKVAERLHAKEVPIAVTTGKPVPSWAQMWIRKPLLVTAALVVIIVSSVIFIQHAHYMKNLYTVSAFSPPVYIESETRGVDTGEVAEAMTFYTRGNYTQALEILKKVPNPGRNPQVIFFKGICYLLVDELKRAIKDFDIIIENMDPSYYDEAIYYKAIALLRLNKKGKALELLQQLAGMFSPYAPKAGALFEQVSNL